MWWTSLFALGAAYAVGVGYTWAVGEEAGLKGLALAKAAAAWPVAAVKALRAKF